jgi:predicted SprT family Zn-dependent metalloprotease
MDCEVIYVFGEMHENAIEDIIVHETVHYVLLKVAGKRASLRLDNIYQQLDI